LVGVEKPIISDNKYRYPPREYKLVKISAMTTIEVIDGIKYPDRKIARPLKFFSISNARTKAIIVVAGMVPKTKIKVFFREIRKD